MGDLLEALKKLEAVMPSVATPAAAQAEPESPAAAPVVVTETKPLRTEGPLNALFPMKNVVMDLDPDATPALYALDDFVHTIGAKATITSAKRNNPKIKSHHNTGTAVDIVVGDRAYMEQMAEKLQAAGFSAAFERAGQKNKNGSKATGDHIHVTLKPMSAKPALSSDGVKQALITALASQESSGDPNAVNARTGAAGMYQIMPGNIAQWSREALGKPMTVAEYQADPEAQQKIAEFKLTEFYGEALRRAGGDPLLAAQYTANKWYSNNYEPHRRWNVRPRADEPSPREYWEQVRSKMGNVQVQVPGGITAPRPAEAVTAGNGIITAEEAAKIGTGTATTAPVEAESDTPLADAYIEQARKREYEERQQSVNDLRETAARQYLMPGQSAKDPAPQQQQAQQQPKSRFDQQKQLTRAEAAERMRSGNVPNKVIQPEWVETDAEREEKWKVEQTRLQKESAERIKRGDLTGHILAFAAQSPTNAALIRATLSGADALTLGIGSAMAGEEQMRKDTPSTGNEILDSSIDVAGGTIGGLLGLKGAGSVVRALAPGLSAVKTGAATFGLAATPENTIKAVKGDQGVIESLAKIGVATAVGAAQVKAELAIPRIARAVEGHPNTMARTGWQEVTQTDGRLLSAAIGGATQAPLGPAQMLVEGAIEGRMPSGEELVESALTSGLFGAYGGWKQAKARAVQYNEQQARALPQGALNDQAPMQPRAKTPTVVDAIVDEPQRLRLPGAREAGPSSEPVHHARESTVAQKALPPRRGETAKPGERVEVTPAKIPVTVEVAAGQKIELEADTKNDYPAEHTPDHNMGLIHELGQTKDKPMIALFDNERSNRRLYIVDLYDDGKFVSHAVVMQTNGEARVREMLTQDFGGAVAKDAVVHSTTQSSVKALAEMGDLNIPFGEQFDALSAAYKRGTGNTLTIRSEDVGKPVEQPETRQAVKAAAKESPKASAKPEPAKSRSRGEARAETKAQAAATSAQTASERRVAGVRKTAQEIVNDPAATPEAKRQAAQAVRDAARPAQPKPEVKPDTKATTEADVKAEAEVKAAPVAEPVAEAAAKPVADPTPVRAQGTMEAEYEPITSTAESDVSFFDRLRKQHTESAPVEDKSTLNSSLFGAVIGQKKKGQRATPPGTSKAAFTDADPVVAARMKAAREAKKPTWLDQTSTWVKETAVKFTTEYPMLKRGASTAEVRFATAKMHNAAKAAETEVGMRLRQIFTKLDRTQQHNVQEKIIRDDLMEDLARQKQDKDAVILTKRRVAEGETQMYEIMYADGTRTDVDASMIASGTAAKGESVKIKGEVKLPFGFSEESLTRSHKEIGEIIAKDKDAAQAVEDYHRYVRLVADTHAKLYERATGDKLNLDRNEYFRHQVLKYMDEAKLNSGSFAQKLVNPRGFYKKRQGSTEDYSLDFWDVMPKTLRQMEADNARLEFLVKLKEQYHEPAVKAAKDAAIKAGEKMIPVYTPKSIRDAKQQAEAAGSDKWRDFLPTEPANWTKYLPEGYTEFKPGPEQNFFRTYTPVEQKLAEIMAAQGKEIGIRLQDMKQVLTVEDGKKIYVPEEIKPHLDWITRPTDKPGAQLWRTGWGWWKNYMLNNPWVYLKVQLRNGVTDAQRFAHNPRAARKLGQSFGEIYNVVIKKHSATPDLEEFMKRGGMDNVYDLNNEVSVVNEMKALHNHFEDPPLSTRLNPLRAYAKMVRIPSTIREATGRYAMYLEYLTQMRKNGGKPLNYGASDRNEINAMKDIHDKAYLLANDLMVNYQQVSVSGQFLARHLFPFFRFTEGNLRTTLGVLRNDIKDIKELKGAQRIGAAVARKLGAHATRLPARALGAVLRSPLLSIGIAKWYLASSSGDILMRTWNTLFADEEDRELMPDVRETAHITAPGAVNRMFGFDESTSLYFNRLSGFDDAMAMFGIEGLNFGAQQILTGEKPAGDVIDDIVKADKFWNTIANKWGQGAGPWQSIGELFAGKSFFPDVLNPRQQRDPVEAIFASLHLRDAYRAMADKPTDGKMWERMFIYATDHDKAAYDKIRSKAAEFADKKGSGGYEITPKSNAAYYFKEAIKLGDIEAAKVQLHKYMTLHLNEKLKEGDPKWREITPETVLNPAELSKVKRGLEASLRALDPLAQMDEERRTEFVASLDEQETKDLERAYAYLEDLMSFGEDKLPFREEFGRSFSSTTRALTGTLSRAQRAAQRMKDKAGHKKPKE